MTTPAGGQPPSDVAASIVRTVVPFLVSVLIGQATRIGLNLDEGATTQIVTAVVFAVYYSAARWIETNLSTQTGRIMLSLGLTKAKPVYHKPLA